MADHSRVGSLGLEHGDLILESLDHGHHRSFLLSPVVSGHNVARLKKNIYCKDLASY